MSDIIVAFVIAILRALVPALFQAAKPTSEDGAPDIVRREELRSRVKKTWSAEALAATDPTGESQ